MFRLLSYFALSCAIVLAISTAILVGAYQRHATAELVTATEKQNVAMAQVISNSIWPRFSGYLTGVRITDGDELRARPETAQLHAALSRITKGLPVHKIKFYNLAGTTVYSSEFSQIGQDKSNQAGFIDAAIHQKPVSKISNRDTFTSYSGELHAVDLVESYAPVKDATGNTLGVFELYYDVSAAVDQIAKDRGTVGWILTAVFAGLFVVLVLVVHRAELILKRQYNALQDALIEKERLSILGRLTATVGHELRNPLAALRNTLFIIRSLSDGQHEMKPYIETGERSIARCDNIVQDLLECNRQQELECKPYDLSDWTRQVVEEQVIPAAIRIELDLPVPGPIVNLDDDRFRRVLINLIENAIQAHAAPGPDHYIRITAKSDNGFAQVSVEDNGAGIAADVLPKIFEPLYTTKSFGTGLGLPTAKRLVQQHGGELVVDSTEGIGTNFKITLPCVQQLNQEAA